jgi:hypothetical protein
VEVRRIKVQGQTIRPDKKFRIPHLNQWLHMVVHDCHPRYIRKHNRKIQAGPGIKQDPTSEIISVKKGWQSGSSGRVPEYQVQVYSKINKKQKKKYSKNRD